jgi:conflict system STAND superfamily ATPase
VSEQETPVLDAENPWPGLAPFDEAQADFFYGRQREVEDLFRRVRLNLLTVLYGQSGLGKTSLVRAALFPRLRGAALLPVPIRLDYSDGAPAARAQIWQALSAALQQAGVRVPGLAEDQTLWEYFHARSLAKTLVPVLVFDQFEELFTLGSERAGGTGFVRDFLVELAALIENRPPDRVEARFDREPRLVAQYDFDRQDYRVLLSLREDYLAHLHDLSTKLPSITLNNMRLTPLDGLRALEAVEKPGGKLVAPGAAEAIVRVVAGNRGEGPARSAVDLLGTTDERRVGGEQTTLESLVVDPSLLSLLCREVNQKRREDGMAAITPQLVEANRENILHNFYERCLATLPEAVQIFVEEDLLTESGFRETLSVENAGAKLRRRGGDPRALTTLVNRRLLHFEQRGAVTRIELTHDVLAPVVRQSRSLRREREAIQESEARKRRELEENERVAQQARAEAEAKYERSKRQRRVFAGFGIAMAAVAAIAVYLGLQARDQSKEARDQRDRANTLLKQVETQNANLEQQKKALSDTTLVATLARDLAHQMAENANRERAKGAALLADFCTYGLKVINRFGDSTSNNSALRQAYNSLVEISDSSVDSMRVRSPQELCPQQLDARISSISAGLRRELGDSSGSVQQGRHGLEAARKLAPYPDSISQWIATRSFSDLTSTLYFDQAYEDALVAAQAGIPLARAVEPGRDSTALDRLARIYHYGALALLELKRIDEARNWVDQGLTAVESGRRRKDQYQPYLLFTKSQLHMRAAEADSAQALGNPTASLVDHALVAMRQAAEAARARVALTDFPNQHKWLAQIHGWAAGRARGVRRYPEALAAYDSSAASWDFLVRLGRRNADTSWISEGLRAIGNQLMGKAQTLLAMGRRDEALAQGRAARDTLEVLVGIQASFVNQHAQALVLDSLGLLFDLAARRQSADSAYRREYVIDSVIAYLPTTGASDMWTFDGTLLRLMATNRRRAIADTVGADSARTVDLLVSLAGSNRYYLEQQVKVRRWLLTDALRKARNPADSERVMRREGEYLKAVRRNLSSNVDGTAELLEKLGRRSTADSFYFARSKADSQLFAGRKDKFLDDARSVEWLASRRDLVLQSREQADTAGRPIPEQVRALRLNAEATRRPRETLVWIRQQVVSLAQSGARTRADSLRRAEGARDSLAQALGNLAWTYLLIQRPEQAVQVAADGKALSAKQSFILPNYFNALVLSGTEEQAAQFFRDHATEQVETRPVLFACAVLRDIRELRWREVASDRQVQFVERLAAPYLTQCQLPKLPSTP